MNPIRNDRIALPIKILLCGLGWWGINWLKNIRANKDYHLAGVVEKNSRTLAIVQEEQQIDASICFTDITKAIRAAGPDAVAVVVSPDKHGEIIRVAIENNVHILSEKPLAKNLAEAKDFLRMYNKNKGLRFVVNQNYRGRVCIAALKDLIESKEVGEIGFFIFSHQQTVKIPGYRLEMSSPILDDMSIHHFDLMRYLTNQDFDEIYANEETVNWSWFKGKPVLYAKIRMTNQVSGIYCGSWASEGKIGSWNGNIQLFGSKGCLELNDEGKVLIYQKHDVDESLLGRYFPGKEIELRKLQFSELQYTLESFKNDLLNNIRSETSIEDNIKSFAAVIAAKQSIIQNRPVRIKSLGL
jgi:predicted dehydrogenase